MTKASKGPCATITPPDKQCYSSFSIEGEQRKTRGLSREGADGGGGKSGGWGSRDLEKGVRQACQMAFQGEGAEKNVPEPFTRLAGYQNREEGGDLLGGADIYQTGIIDWEELGDRAPTRGEDGEGGGEWCLPQHYPRRFFS